MSESFEVSSEIYNETDFQAVKYDNGRVISKFKFNYPLDAVANRIAADKDGDLIIPKRKQGIIEIEHQSSTVLKLVGLQVWRGALLLADFLFYKRLQFIDKQVIELGAGVGLTSIAAGIFCKQVVCTDIDIGGILDLIRANIKTNKSLLRRDIEVMEFDFQKPISDKLNKALKDTDIVIAADVIYDDDITDCFIEVIDKLLDESQPKKKTIYIALEKRYVFTLAELDVAAPCFDYFLRKIDKKSWTIKYIPTDFPQYFKYERCKDLVLLEIGNDS